ncbi:hypothetical protein HZA45_02780 [Candidatus Peregrinibacteria bacterium]|nr:hypothetical protein [Candidatus Peregrinibacteria bacterium]
MKHDTPIFARDLYKEITEAVADATGSVPEAGQDIARDRLRHDVSQLFALITQSAGTLGHSVETVGAAVMPPHVIRHVRAVVQTFPSKIGRSSRGALLAILN